MATVAQPTALEELAWIHDCEVPHVTLAVNSSGERQVTISMACPVDLGYEPWNGKTIEFTASDVAAMNNHLLGMQTTPETIDCIRPGVSASLISDLDRAPFRGAPLKFSVIFHSGSDMEIACRAIQVRVL